MRNAQILVLNNGPYLDRLENRLNASPYTWTGAPAHAFDRRSLTETIKPEVIFLLTPHIDHFVLRIIQDINQSEPKPTVLFVDDPETLLDEAMEAGVSSVVPTGTDCPSITGIIAVAKARFNHSRRLMTELAQFKLKLEDRKVIEKAKGILIQSQSCSEDEAYHLLRKLAMERNLRMAEMAKNVIAMAELLHE